MHHPTDVIAGSLIGIFVQVINLLLNKTENPSSPYPRALY
jgi:hypothetical protein